MENRLIEKQNQFSKVMAYSIIGVLLFYNIYVFFIHYFKIDILFFLSQTFLIFLFIFVTYLIYLLSKTKYNFYTLYNIISIAFLGLILYLCLLLNHVTNTIYLLFLPLLFLILMLSNIKRMLWFLFVFSVLVIFIPYISEHLQISKPLNIPHKIGSQKLVFPDYIIIFVSLYLSAIILYFYIEFIKINTSLDNENKNPFLTKETNDETEKEEIFETLYSKTINYLENTKAYKNPEFSRKKLAFDLNTNETYVSIALSKKGIKNFNNLINTYRINQVKEDISKNKNSLNKIYLDAGFTHQSTFNRVFKEIVGITPSEYMKNHIVFK